MTKEQIDALVKSLDRLGLGTNDGDVVRKLQSAQTDGLLMSVISIPLCSYPHRIFSSALEHIDNKLRDTFNRIEAAGCTGSDDGNIVSELVDEIRAAIANFQVSSKAQTGRAI